MKYSEAKNKIKDYLISVFGTTWRDNYEIRDQDDALFLSTYLPLSDQLQDVLMVSKQKKGWFEAKNLIGFEKPLADIFMELALTPLEEREEEKKYVVKVWDLADSSSILVEDRITGLLNILTTNAVDMLNLSYRVAFTKNEINQLKSKSALHIDWDKAVEEYNGEI